MDSKGLRWGAPGWLRWGVAGAGGREAQARKGDFQGAAQEVWDGGPPRSERSETATQGAK